MNDMTQAMHLPQREHFLVPDVRCANCCLSIEKKLGGLSGIDALNVSYAQKRLTFDSASPDVTEQVLKSVAAMGYQILPDTEGEQLEHYQKEKRGMLARLGVAGIGMMQVMMFALASYVAGEAGIDSEYESLMRWASFIIAVPVTFFSAMPFHQGAVRDLRNGMLGMDVPVSIAITAAFSLSAFHTITQSGEVYFDSACMFTFLLLTGRFLELSARQNFKVEQTLGEHLLPAVARLSETGEPIALRRVVPGHCLKVLPGESIPADGTVLEGSGSVDESAFTGEAKPVFKHPGETVFAGAINLDGEIVLRVDAEVDDWVISHLSKLYQKAAGFKPAFAVLADRIARYFVSAVLCLALGAGFFWWQAGSPDYFAIALAVMVVSCPCALSLATPVAYAIATGAVQKQGVLIASGTFLEKLSTVDTIVFDKTGTLTEGVLELHGIDLIDNRFDEARLISMAASLEAQSLHPVANTLRLINTTPLSVTEQQQVPGMGVSGYIDGEHFRFGKPDFALPGSTAPESNDYYLVLLSMKDKPIAWFRFSDKLRVGAPGVVSKLKTSMREVTAFSGDASEKGRALLLSLGIDNAQTGMSPEAKIEGLRALQQSGRRVLMIGDGLNDAGAMAVADVSLAVNPVDKMVQSAADATLVNGELEGLPNLFAYASKVNAVIRQNISWAVIYNFSVIPLAVAGFVPPWAAALGMSLSSLMVTLNACRLAKVN